MNLNKLYKLPWTDNDNPNGWIEPTTYCQLKCPGCYRGLDIGSIKPIHLDLDTLKKQVINFDEKRNASMISIAGGEPLMYPYIEELIKFISERKLFTKVYTNGILLNEKMLLKLKKVGVTDFMIHIDMFQNRPGWKGKTEIDLMKLRQKIVDLFNKVGGLNFGFVMPISKNNIKYLPELVKFFRKNIESINIVSFTVFTDFHDNNKSDFNAEYLSNEISKYFSHSPSAYLPKVKNNDIPAWLISIGFGNNKTYFGDIDSKIYKILVEYTYKKTGKYAFARKEKQIKLFPLLLLIFVATGRKILKNILTSKNKNVFHQSFVIIDLPNMIGDWCDGCPDSMYVGDKLYPSCYVNEYKPFKDKFLKKEKEV